MSRIYDNWERLVAATLRREQLWQLCHAPSSEPSISSRSSDFSCPSPLPNVPFDSLDLNSTSWYNQNSVPAGAGTIRWGTYNTNGFEVDQHSTVKAEKSQVLAPEEIFVNGEPLCQEKLNILQSCPHPPKKLKPGYYWYDKASGFWGKQGKKPLQIISPHLNVAGPVHLDASNGNSQILINGRQITKVEQRMLKFAGVTCWPNTHLWMDENGSYQLEGMNTHHSIWDKVGMKLLCSVLSLPFPPKSSPTCGEQSVPQYPEQKTIEKLVLIGCNGSGTSTIFKQAVEILKPDHKPSKVDIEHVTSSIRLSCLDFSFPDPAYNDDDDADRGDLHDSLLRFQLIRLQVKDFGENSMWHPMFEDVQIVLFCVSLCDYDQFSVDGDGNKLNKMLLSKRFFENMVTHPTFDQIDFLLILNKFDLFEEKIEQVPLGKCNWFDDFHPVMSRNFSNSSNNANQPTLGQLGFHFIAVKFKRLYSALTGRKLYVSLVKSLEPNSVVAALKYAREILKWDEEGHKFSLSGCSSSSIGSSSLSD